MAQDGGFINDTLKDSAAKGEGIAVKGESSAVKGLFGRATKVVLDVLLPPQCLGCGVLVDTQGALCSACWSKVEFLQPPCCHACGLTFDYDQGEGALCGACTRRHPPYDRARAVMTYDEDSRGLILAFKHGDRTEAAPAFGRWLTRAGCDLLADANLIVPVPLHWTRLLLRRFNQSALLAQAVGTLSHVQVAPDLLVRRRRTPSQGRLSLPARRRNVSGAFSVRKRAKSLIEGRRVLLVDDVMTTGATVEACARVLMQGGAAAVDVLTLARVFRPI